MNAMTITDFKQTLRNVELDKLGDYLPIMVYVHEEPKYFFDRVDMVVPLSDIHPRVRAMIRGLEAKARAGMPPPQKIKAPPKEWVGEENSS